MRAFVRLASLVSLGILAAAVALPLVAQDQPPKKVPPEQRLVTVPGDQPWVGTDIRIGERDRVTISATGRVCFSGEDKLGCVSADGYDRAKYNAGDFPADLASCDDPLPDAGHAALIASVDGKDFAVGSRLVFDGKAGSLRLGVSDCTFRGMANQYNTGRYNVAVKIERDAVPGR